MAVAGVLFDLDDTLFDHRGAADSGVRAWLATTDVGEPVNDCVERWFALEACHHARFQRGEITHADQRRARIRAFLPQRDLTNDAVADEAFAGYLAHYRAAWAAHDDAAAALGRAATAGLAVGILTNGDQDIQESKVRHVGLGSYGVPVLASSTLPAAKPDPRAFRSACATLGVDHADVVMVGDSPDHDVRGALAAGLAAVLVDRVGRFRQHGVAGAARIESLAELTW